MNILILCTGNSCRSQIAHGFLQHFTLPDFVHVYSAGIETHGVNPRAVETMHQIGIDISQHTSNHIQEYLNIPFDVVITVCDHASENCPVFPTHAIKLHHNFPDPAKAIGSEIEVQSAFAGVRELIREYLTQFTHQHIPTEYYASTFS